MAARPLTAEPAIPAGTELLDARAADPATARTMLAELASTNRWLGGHAAVRYGVAHVAEALPTDRPVRVLDVGAGGGDVLACVAQTLAQRGHDVRAVALDHHRTGASVCRRRGFAAVCGDWNAAPLAAQCADLVVATLVLHHLAREAVPAFLARLTRWSRGGVVVSDLQRSRVAGWGLRTIGTVGRFHPATIRDGVVSLARGFTRAELSDLLQRAGIPNATVHRRPGWRIVACWSAKRC